MILLDGQTMAVKQAFYPETENPSLNADDISTATISIGPEAPTLERGNWMKDTLPNGQVIVWRVKDYEEDVTIGTRTAQLEDLVAELKDTILFGDTTTAMLAGRLGATTCTPAEALNYIFSKQNTWTLGQCVYEDELPFEFNNVSLFDAIEEICSALLNYYWQLDYSTFPFTFNVLRKTDAVACEMRETRNITSIKRKIDWSQLWTRYYPVGNGNIHIGDVNDGVDYVEKNTDLYGTVEHQETDNTIRQKELLKAKALEKLERHCQPVVTVTISGLELSQATGEEMDRLVINTMCRVPLPELNDVIRERIVKLVWPDAINRPEEVTVTLANQIRDVATIINQLKKSGGGGGSAAAKDAEIDRAWFTDTDTYVAMTAGALAGTNPDGSPNWSRIAQIMVDGHGIDETVTELDGTTIKKTAQLQTADDILNTATAYTDSEIEDNVTGTAFWQDKDNIQGVTGEFEVQTDQVTGKKTIVLKSGGGMKIRRDNVEYGLYDEGNLTGGLMVQMINGQTTTKLLGDHIVIGDSDETVDDMYTNFAGSITEINGDLVTIQSDITSIESEQVDINADIVDLLTRVLSLESDELNYHVRTQNLEDANVNIHADINGLESTIDTVQSSVDTIEGTALWQYHDEIGAFAGIMYKGTDQKLHIRSGSGLMIDEGQSSLGVYTEGSLTAAVIVDKINGGTVKISAPHIELDGETVANVLDGQDISCSNLSVAVMLTATNASITGGADVGYLEAETVEAGSIELNGREMQVVNASVSGNTLTITKADGSTINFNKVTTPTLHGSWSGGILSITSTPAAESNLYYYLGRGTVTWSGVTGTVPITAAPSSSSPGSTVYTTTVTAPFHKVNHPTTGVTSFNAYAYSGGEYVNLGSHNWYYHT